MTWLDDEAACYRALETRDRRFDGRLYVGVTSTGIYCRPICPARTPKREHCRFFPTAAAAQEAGFHACLRCRPEISPEVAGWRGTSNTVSRALAFIAEGFLDRPDASVEALAERAGVGDRQLRRLFEQHLGASPIAVAQTRRVLFAKQLIHDTQLSMATIAMASGFGSIRRFNEAFRTLYRRPPSDLRRHKRPVLEPHAPVQLQIPYRPPYDWDAMLAFLAVRAIDGVETVDKGRYCRVLSEGDTLGLIEIAHDPARKALLARIQFPCVRSLPVIVARVRNVFDVGADVDTIAAHLGSDAALAGFLSERPGLRCPGGWNGFEVAVRAILGQQVTITAAKRLAKTLVRMYGKPLGANAALGLTHAFPSAECLAAADVSSLGMPESRKAALKALARTAMLEPKLFEPVGSVEDVVTRLRALPGVGEWTAHYIALRALREPDAFPASDAGLLRGAACCLGGTKKWSPSQLMKRAEAWRPWRAYAAQYLWAVASRDKEQEAPYA